MNLSRLNTKEKIDMIMNRSKDRQFMYELILKLYDKAMDIWIELFSDKNTPKISWESFRKYQRNLKRAANRMINQIYFRDTVSFFDMEWWLKERKGDEHRYAEDMLDAFGFIQEEHDIANGRTEFGMIGYHYFLAEDGVSSLKLPECYLRNYYQKYKNNKDYE